MNDEDSPLITDEGSDNETSGDGLDELSVDTQPPLKENSESKDSILYLPPSNEISMDKLEGTIDKSSGEVLLQFESQFIFSIGAMIRFPNLFIKTSLQTGKVKGKLHESKGNILQKNGKTKLVGISTISPTGNKVLDTFLGLPNEALAELKCVIQ